MTNSGSDFPLFQGGESGSNVRSHHSYTNTLRVYNKDNSIAMHNYLIGGYYSWGTTSQGFPVYRHQYYSIYLYVDTNKYWIFGPKIGVASGWAWNPTRPTPSKPPVNGWYVIKNNRWTDGPTFRVTTGTALVMFEHSGERGGYRHLLGPTPNFVSINFNDVVSSIRSIKGRWELYEDIHYVGRRMIISDGQKTNTYVNDFYSSGRPICTYSEDPTTAKLQAYEHNSQQGRMKEFLTDEKWIGRDWNDRISSVYAVKGDWELYQHLNFEGVYEVIREGEQKNVRRNDDCTSLRPLCETYSAGRKCQLEKIEVIDDGSLEPKYTGTQIIGSNNGGSCYGPAEQSLELSSTDSTKNTFGLEISESAEVNWHISASVAVEASAKFLGSGGSVTATVEAGIGGSYTVSYSKSNTYTSGNNVLVGQSTSYKLPGAALAFGMVDRYTIDKSNTPVNMHMKCPDGDTFVKKATIRMKSTTYQSAHFWSLVGRFNSDACKANRNLPECVRGVRIKYSNFLGKKDAIRYDFERCFADGKGSVDK